MLMFHSMNEFLQGRSSVNGFSLASLSGNRPSDHSPPVNRTANNTMFGNPSRHSPQASARKYISFYFQGVRRQPHTSGALVRIMLWQQCFRHSGLPKHLDESS
jgi:hypothetical protein